MRRQRVLRFKDDSVVHVGERYFGVDAAEAADGLYTGILREQPIPGFLTAEYFDAGFGLGY